MVRLNKNIVLFSTKNDPILPAIQSSSRVLSLDILFPSLQISSRPVPSHFLSCCAALAEGELHDIHGLDVPVHCTWQCSFAAVLVGKSSIIWSVEREKLGCEWSLVELNISKNQALSSLRPPPTPYLAPSFLLSLFCPPPRFTLDSRRFPLLPVHLVKHLSVIFSPTPAWRALPFPTGTVVLRKSGIC